MPAFWQIFIVPRTFFLWRPCRVGQSVGRPTRTHDRDIFPQWRRWACGEEGRKEIQRERLNRRVRKSLKSKSCLGNSIPDHREREREVGGERGGAPNLYCCASEISDCLYSPPQPCSSSFVLVPPSPARRAVASHTFLLSDSDRSRRPRPPPATSYRVAH